MKPPLSRCGIPQANSTTSWPRLTSPSASETTLPCSAVMISASSPLRALSSSRNANRIWVRLASEVSRHAGNAAAAASITARASSTLPSATSTGHLHRSPDSSPVRGAAGAREGLVVDPMRDRGHGVLLEGMSASRLSSGAVVLAPSTSADTVLASSMRADR